MRCFDVLRNLYDLHSLMNRRIICWRLPLWMKDKLIAEIKELSVPLIEGEKPREDSFLGIPVQYGMDWEVSVISEERKVLF